MNAVRGDAPDAAVALVSRVLADTLGVEAVGVDDNFFDLGGRSLQAAQVAQALARELARDVPLAYLFEHPTPRSLAARLSANRASPASTVESPPAPPESRYLLPYQYLYFGEGHDAYEHEFVIEAVFEPGEALDPSRLARSITHVIARHDALRTAYVLDAGRRRLTVVPVEADDVLVIAEADAQDDDDLQGEVIKLADRLVAGIETQRGHVIRIGYLRAPHRSLLLVTVHHLACDAYGLAVLIGDLEETYRERYADRGDPRPPPTSAIWWADRIGRYVDSGESEAEKEYWRTLPATRPLPFLRAPASTTGTTCERVGILAAEHAARLPGAAEAFALSPNELILACLGYAAHRIGGDDVVVISNTLHGRDLFFDGIGCATTVAWLTYTVPVVLQIPDATLADVVQSAPSQLATIPRRGIANLQLAFAGGSDPAAERLREIRANVQLHVNFMEALGQIHSDPAAWPRSRHTVDRAIDPSPRLRRIRVRVARNAAGALHVVWHYNPDFYADTSIEALNDALLAALTTMTSDS
jgi:hypothetical protein